MDMILQHVGCGVIFFLGMDNGLVLNADSYTTAGFGMQVPYQRECVGYEEQGQRHNLSSGTEAVLSLKRTDLR